MLGFLSHFLVRISKAVWYGFIWLCIRVFVRGEGVFITSPRSARLYDVFFLSFSSQVKLSLLSSSSKLWWSIYAIFYGIGIFFCLKGFILDNCYLELLHLLKGLNNGQQRLIKTGNQILLKGRPKGKPEKRLFHFGEGGLTITPSKWIIVHNLKEISSIC